MIIPKILAQNSGFDPQESIVKLQVHMMTLCCLLHACLCVFAFKININVRHIYDYDIVNLYFRVMLTGRVLQQWSACWPGLIIRCVCTCKSVKELELARLLSCVLVFIWGLYIGEPMLPGDEGVWDNYRVKKTLLHSW